VAGLAIELQLVAAPGQSVPLVPPQGSAHSSSPPERLAQKSLLQSMSRVQSA
jgi:hypothetical protein